MGNVLSHDPWKSRLSEYLDGELPAPAATALEEHVAACAECRQVLGDLRAVVTRAQALPDRPPDVDLWPAVARRIEGSASPSQPGRASRRRQFSFTLPQLVAAGLALMVLSGGMVWLARLGGPRTDFPAVVADDTARPAGPVPAAVPATFADAHYDEAIADLQQTLEAGRAQLDPGTVRALEENLLAIDRAIEQCRLALAGDPANEYLAEHLAAAKKRKIALLRRANALTSNAGI